MKVARIRIQNVMGIEQLEIEPQAVTVVTGKNGSGKTSVMEAVKSVVGGGHDATLIRNGCESGEIVLIMDDGTEVRKRITQAGSSLTVKHPEFGKVSRGQTWLNGLADALSFNPVEFLTCDDDKRVQYVLDSSKVSLDPAELRAAVGGLMDVPDEIAGHPLKVIERVHQHIYDLRTGENRTAKDARSTIEQLKGSLPEDVQSEAEAEAEVDRLEAESDTLSKAIADAEGAARAEARKRTAGRLKEIGDRTAQIINEIAALEAEDKELRGERDKLEEATEADADAAAKAAASEAREQLKAVERDLHAARQTAKTATTLAATIANTKKMIAGHETKATGAHKQSQALTAALAQLDALKGRVLEQSPIKGLDLRGGQLYWGDVPWPRVNHAERVKIAMQLAKHRAGDLPLCCVDGLETLDPKTFAAFVKAAPRSGLQFIVTRVGAEDGLSIQTFAAEQEGATA